MPDYNPFITQQKFLEWWFLTEKYFKEIATTDKSNQHWLSLLNLMRTMSLKGYDKHLYAERTLDSRLILSRSFDGSLRPDQAHIYFETYPDGSLTLHCTFDGIRTEHHFDRIEWNDDIRGFLDRLVQEPIS